MGGEDWKEDGRKVDEDGLPKAGDDISLFSAGPMKEARLSPSGLEPAFDPGIAEWMTRTDQC